ncbi:MAG: CHAT domain-containing tetratricopeptide repeat protein [Bacteroidia bacterium]
MIDEKILHIGIANCIDFPRFLFPPGLFPQQGSAGDFQTNFAEALSLEYSEQPSKAARLFSRLAEQEQARGNTFNAYNARFQAVFNLIVEDDTSYLQNIALLENMRQSAFSSPDSLAGDTFFIAGLLAQKSPEQEGALNAFRRALALRKRHCDSGSLRLFRAYQTFIDALANKGHIDSCLLYIQEGNKLQSKDASPFIRGRYALEEGQIFRLLGLYYEAEKRLMEGSEYPDLPPFVQASFLSNIAGLHADMGNISKAISFQTKAMDVFSSKLPEDHFMQMMGNSDLGYFVDLAGDWEKGLTYHLKALALGQKYHPNLPELGIMLNNIAHYYKNSGDTDRYFEYIKASGKLYRTIVGPDHEYMARYHQNMAMGWMLKGDFPKAHTELDSALAIFRLSFPPDHFRILSARHLQAEVFRNQGDIQQSEKNHLEVIRLTKQHKSQQPNELVIATYRSLAYMTLVQGNAEKSLSYSRAGLLEAGYPADESALNSMNVENKPGVISSLNSVMVCNNAINHLLSDIEDDKVREISLCSEKLLYSEASLKVLLHLLNTQVGSTWGKLDMIQKQYWIFSDGVAASTKLYELTGKEEYLEKAWYFSEASRASLLNTMISIQDISSLGGVPPAIIEHWKEYHAESSFLQRQMGRISNQAAQLNLQEKYFSASKKLDSLKLLINTRYPDLAQIIDGVQVQTFDDFNAARGKNGEVYISYFEGGQDYFAFVFNNQYSSLFRIKDKNEINTRLERYMHFCTNARLAEEGRGNDSLVSLAAMDGKWLYDKLLAPAIAAIPENSKLEIFPHGSLAYFPFEALLVDAIQSVENWNSWPYLIKKHPINYHYSSLRFSPANTTSLYYENQYQYLGFAPSYGDENDNLRFPTLSEGTWREFYSQSPGAFRPLKHNVQEVKETWEFLSGKIFKLHAASKARFVQMASRGTILHCAAHGLVDDQHPLESGIAFYAPSDQQDGVLKVHEIMGLDLHADLAILSACHTGAGTEFRGEGVMSVAYAFQYAGCKSILMNRWRAYDISTREITTAFIKNWKSGLLKSEALQKARLDMMNATSMSHPYFWAGYSLVGHDSFFPQSKKPRQYNLLACIGLVLFSASVSLLLFRETGRKNART